MSDQAQPFTTNHPSSITASGATGFDWRYAFLATTSATLCYLLTRTLGVGSGYWAAITSLVVCQPDFGTTVMTSRDRLVGTAVGGLTGLLTIAIWHQHFAIFAVGLLSTLLLCNLIRGVNAGKLAGVTFCIVVLVPHPGMDSLHTATSRFFEVTLGICVTLLTTVIFCPLAALRAVKAVFHPPSQLH